MASFSGLASHDWPTRPCDLYLRKDVEHGERNLSMRGRVRTGLSHPPLGAILAALMFSSIHFTSAPASAAGISTAVQFNRTESSIVRISHGADQVDPWGHHSGRYDWNHYWTLMPPAIYSPPRPWRWTPFTMPLRRFPHAVPFHHMAGMFGGWSYDYRANPTILINLFPDYVIRRVTEDTRALHFTAYKKALDAEIGDTISWTSGNIRGSVTTTRVGWSGRRYCREFRQDIFIDERPQQTIGTVCQERGGDWQITPNQ